MKIVKLKTLKELYESDLFKIEFSGEMVKFSRKETRGYEFFISAEYFGREVLLVDMPAINENFVNIHPEIISNVMEDGFVRSSVHKKLKDKFSILDSLSKSKYEFKLRELESQVQQLTKELDQCKKQ